MRTLAAFGLIAIGLIGAFGLGFLALFTVGAIGEASGGPAARIAAALVTATPLLCLAAAWSARNALMRARDVPANPAYVRSIAIGAGLLVLTLLIVQVEGPLVRVG